MALPLPFVQPHSGVESPSPAGAVRLLDRVRHAVRTLHDSYRTEQAYVDWIRRFILFHGKRHPQDLGAREVGDFLSHLAVERHVSASTQTQAHPDRPDHGRQLAGGCKNATVNRVLALLRAILRKCVNDWEWLDKVPAVRMLREPSRRIRYLTRQEAMRLLAELPEHLADMAAFSLATGLRANVTGLMWSQVDLERRLAWIHQDQAKARKAIPVPLNAEAVAAVAKQLGKHAMHVFSYRGSRITQVSTGAWYSALKRAGIEDFRWHDLRHTWASWHVQGGTPLFVLQEMGGWASAEMVRRYAHLATDHLAPYAERLGGPCGKELAVHGTNPSQA